VHIVSMLLLTYPILLEQSAGSSSFVSQVKRGNIITEGHLSPILMLSSGIGEVHTGKKMLATSTRLINSLVGCFIIVHEI